MSYDLELDRLVKRIKKKGHKTILVQLPEGLKPRAKEVADRIRKETKAKVLIWLDTCFGGCDFPLGISQLGIDMVVQFGHNKFKKIHTGW